MTKRNKKSQAQTKARNLSPRNTAVASRMREILGLLGEDNRREGLLETPERYAQAMDFLTRGYQIDIQEIVGNALFESPSSEMVIVRDIELFSMCEHHLLPFYGKAHVAYIPRKKIIGLSKIPRIVDAYSRRLQVQERLTDQVAKEIQKILKPAGVAVVVEAFHLCMMMRGVEKQYSYTITSSMQGVFRKNEKTRKEFLGLINTPRTVR